MNLPNGTDTIPLEDIFKELKDNKVEIDLMTLMAILSDLHWLQGNYEAMKWGMEYYLQKKYVKSYLKTMCNGQLFTLNLLVKSELNLDLSFARKLNFHFSQIMVK